MLNEQGHLLIGPPFDLDDQIDMHNILFQNYLSISLIVTILNDS